METINTINNLSIYLKDLEEEQNKQRKHTQRKQNLKIREAINEIKNKIKKRKSMKQRTGSSKRNKIVKLLSRLKKRKRK